jgi:AraC-like DNA-binding protein
VFDEVRKKLAQRYLQNGKQVSEVTFLTGFANQSAFSRAYKAWTGRSPSEEHGRA